MYLTQHDALSGWDFSNIGSAISKSITQAASYVGKQASTIGTAIYKGATQAAEAAYKAGKEALPVVVEVGEKIAPAAITAYLTYKKGEREAEPVTYYVQQPAEAPLTAEQLRRTISQERPEPAKSAAEITTEFLMTPIGLTVTTLAVGAGVYLLIRTSKK